MVRFGCGALARCAGALVLVGLTCAAPAWAQKPMRTANSPFVQKGVDLLNDMNDDGALQAFERALSVTSNTDAERAEICVYMGIAHFNLLKDGPGLALFRKALDYDHDVQLPKMISPKTRKIFEQERAVHKPKVKVKPKAPTGKHPKSKDKSKEIAPRDPRAPYRYAAYGTLGLAVAAGGVGLAMGLMARSEQDKADDLSLPYDQASEHHDTAKSRALLSNVFFGVAGASAVASAVLFYLGFRSVDAPTAALVPLPSGGAMVQVGGVRW